MGNSERTSVRRRARGSRSARSRHRQILAASDRVQRRIGRDLHDGLGPLLIGIGLLAKHLEQELPESFAPKARRLVDLIHGAIDETRNLARGLAPVDLEATTLAGALHDLARAVHVSNVDCRFSSDPSIDDPVLDTRTQLFLIAREAIANVVKHGHATRIEMDLGVAGSRKMLRIADDGRGMPSAPRAGLGLANMSRRARAIGGVLEVGTAPAGGVEVRCFW